MALTHFQAKTFPDYYLRKGKYSITTILKTFLWSRNFLTILKLIMERYFIKD